MISMNAIHPVSDFSRKPGEHIKRLQKTGEPEVLTVNGKAAVVIQDAKTYEKMAKLADYADSVMHLQKALTEEGKPIEAFTAQFEKKYGITR